MIIVGNDLKNLIIQKQIINSKYYDETSISLTLGSEIIHIIPDKENAVLTYQEEIPKEWIKKEYIEEEYLLPPKTAILACSYEKIHMPLGYFGLLQTKGSLARLFVSLHFCDGQIDPGYEGKVTFEILNASNFTIKFKKGQPVGNLYIFKTSTDKTIPYHGKYKNAAGPTIATFKNHN